MHELSLAEGVLQLIEDTARTQGYSRVTAVFLELGEHAAVERESLSFCFDVVTRGSMAEGARLEITDLPGSSEMRVKELEVD